MVVNLTVTAVSETNSNPPHRDANVSEIFRVERILSEMCFETSHSSLNRKLACKNSPIEMLNI